MMDTRDTSGARRIRLDTWGEIARHLGIEVRTAQRWEVRLGLPIRRLAGGQAVYAYVDEIDAWRAAREQGRPDAGAVADSPPPHSSEPVGTGAADPVSAPARQADHHTVDRWWPSSARLLVAAALVAAGIVLLASRAWTIPAAAEPATLTLLGRTLEALDARGARLWSYDLSPGVRPVELSPRRPGLTEWWTRSDLDGDGVDELVVLVDGLAGVDNASESVLCFTLEGGLRFAYTPSLTLRFADGTYTGPWDIFDVEVVQNRGLWVAFAHVPWWPSGIVGLDAAGHATLQYVQPGTVRLLHAVSVDGAPRVMAAGVNNEFASASVALLDPAGPPATAPQRGDGPFRCLECPPGLPDAYLLLLPSPANRRSPYPYNGVTGIVGGPEVQVVTQEAVPSADVVWRVSSDLRRAHEARPSDSYWTWRPDGHAASPWPGGAGHPAAAPYRTWRAGQWTSLDTPYAGVGAR